MLHAFIYLFNSANDDFDIVLVFKTIVLFVSGCLLSKFTSRVVCLLFIIQIPDLMFAE